MKEENFNWLETFIEIQNNKDIKTSNDFKILNSNNIDTNELTKHEGKRTFSSFLQIEYWQNFLRSPV